jgi:radical SAM protein with 4Fe4S-binding SPASM domain
MRTMKIMNLISFGISYQLRKLNLGYRPFFLWIEPTNLCNLRCRICPQSMGGTAERGMMRMETYRKVLDELTDFSPMMVSLHLGGESLLHKDLPAMIRMAKERKMEVTLASNATLLVRELSEALIDAGLDGITVNFSGVPGEFERNFRGAKWEAVYGNMRVFLEAKKRKGGTKPFFSIQVLNLGAGEDIAGNLRKLETLFRGLPVDSIMPVDAHNWSGDFAESGEVDCVMRKDKANYYPCSHLWSSMVIRWNGDVVPCCRDLQGGLVLGNVEKTSLRELWNGPALVEMRKKHRDFRYDEIALCRNCSKLWEGTRPRHYLYRHLAKVPRMLMARVRKGKPQAGGETE